MSMRYAQVVAAVVAFAGVGSPATQAFSARPVPYSLAVTEVSARPSLAAALPTVSPQRYTWVELECLALNIYHEARGESPEGQLAVAQVVLNRASDKRFPNGICEVVKDGGEERRYRCQFSWWCDGRSDKPTDSAAWQTSRQTARAALAEDAIDPTFGALWYHAAYVRPSWADKMTPMATIGSHIFYLD